MKSSYMLDFKGSQCLRHRLILSTLTGSPITVSRIRSQEENPGLTDSEVKFLQLLSAVTNGTQVDINSAGTVLKYSPGLIVNNTTAEPIVVECGPARSLAYYLEGILPVVIFGKNPLVLKLVGCSNDGVDVSVRDMQVDSLVAAYVPLLKAVGVEDVQVAGIKRGVSDGEVTLTLTPIKQIENPLLFVDPGKVKRVRGTVYCSKGNPQMANRVAYSAKGALQRLLPDIWITTDYNKRGSESMLGISLAAESNTGTVLTTDAFRGEASQVEDLESEVPEDLGYIAALQLLDEVFHGGCFDSALHWLPLLLMALGPKGKKAEIVLGRLTNHSVELLRLIEVFLRVKMEIEEVPNPADEPEPSSDPLPMESSDAEYEEVDLSDPLRENFPSNVKLSCIGIGYHNIARVAF